MSLHTRAWSVKSFGGRRFFGPAKKGANLDLPFQRGQIYLPKTLNSLAFDMNMWVLPLNQDGTPDSVLTREEKAHENWRTIIETVDIEGEFDLVKRWYDGTSVKSATARAEFLDGSGPDSDDGRGFYFNLQMMLADPYFYVPLSAFTVTGGITSQCEAPSDHVVIRFTNGVNPRITFHDGNWVQFNGNAGTTDVVIDCRLGTATQGSTHVNGLITRNPAFMSWPQIFVGLNNIYLSGSGAAATLQYDAAYR
jgi:hypothetical protein